MKRVAEALTVSRSRLAERVKKTPAQGRPTRYSKAADEVLLPLIRDIIDHRLTYGYRHGRPLPRPRPRG
jgi:putative transposase